MKQITLDYNIDAPVEDVYLALINPFTIELWSGLPAIMQEEVNSEFSLWDGDINGKNLEFIVNKKLVQEWYFDNKDIQSIVTIELEQIGERTKIHMTHINIPDEVYENMKEGWKKYYFGSLKIFFESD